MKKKIIRLNESQLEKLITKIISEVSVSKDQQRAAGLALSAKRGETPVENLKGSAKEMYDSMTEKQLEDYASTKHKGLPEKVKEDFDWAMGIKSAPDIYRKRINSWDEMRELGKGTLWSVATPQGKPLYDSYVNRYGNFYLYLDKDSDTKVICLGDGSQCFKPDETLMSPETLKKIFKVKDLSDVPLVENFIKK